MKKTALVSALLMFWAGVMTLSAAAPERVAGEWIKAFTKKGDSAWTVNNPLKDDNGLARISVEGEKIKIENDGKRTVVSGFTEGDCMIFSLPVESAAKGSKVDFCIYMGITKAGGPAEWVCEVLDGKKWMATKGHDSFSTFAGKGYNETSYFNTFTLKKGAKDEIQVRLRCIDAGESKESGVYFMSYPRTGAYISAYDAVPVKDTKKILMIGNSFTFFHASYLAFAEIARSQGHVVDIRTNLKGGQNFGQHLGLKMSVSTIGETRYDVALLQNQSQGAAMYADDSAKYGYIMEDAVKIAETVRKTSPACRIILERTWAYKSKEGDFKGYGSYEKFDELLQKGSEALAPAMGADISPIGNAFIKGREAGLPLYHTDSFHQSRVGAYLKACVNYLLIYGEPFDENVSDYGLNPKTALTCRKIAQSVVLK